MRLDYEDLGGEGKSGRARELVLWCQRRRALSQLVSELNKNSAAAIGDPSARIAKLIDQRPFGDDGQDPTNVTALSQYLTGYLEVTPAEIAWLASQLGLSGVMGTVRSLLVKASSGSLQKLAHELGYIAPQPQGGGDYRPNGDGFLARRGGVDLRGATIRANTIVGGDYFEINGSGGNTIGSRPRSGQQARFEDNASSGNDQVPAFSAEPIIPVPATPNYPSFAKSDGDELALRGPMTWSGRCGDDVDVDGDFVSNGQVGGNLSVKGNAWVTGRVSGDIDVDGDLVLTGNVGGDVNVTGTVWLVSGRIGGDLTAGRFGWLSDRGNVSGDIDLQS